MSTSLQEDLSCSTQSIYLQGNPSEEKLIKRAFRNLGYFSWKFGGGGWNRASMTVAFQPQIFWNRNTGLNPILTCHRESGTNVSKLALLQVTAAPPFTANRAIMSCGTVKKWWMSR